MKNDYIYEGKTIAPLPENFPLKEETTFRFKEEWYGHNYGVLIGEEWEDGGVTSLFAKDVEEGSTKIFDVAKTLAAVKREKFTVYDYTKKLLQKVYRYFLVYQIKGHTSLLPTVTGKYILDSCNVDNVFTVEYLFVADEGYKRYFAINYSTPGKQAVSMFDLICDLKEELYDNIDGESDTNYPYVYPTKDGIKVKFYNDVGLSEYIQFKSVEDLMFHLNSVRIVKLENKIQ